ncbi:lytic transglycosylase domain-containing protein [Massilia horti]|uniref:Lytic transglycosylase domain-containing protein n=1 Tax=Massilia horti TaxID=2562153 RepID=A0A4Y9SUJ7_9BURK|nr:lytic transglycosylase domain-containing protein [Massilia horti]TFW30108.1 lytic transglycosylase domain-containing protein [Massilia horti]
MFPLRLLAGAMLAAACTLSAAVQLPQEESTPAPAPAAVPPVPAASAMQGDARADDDIFLQLREAVRQNDADKANAFASRLPNYAIPSYVDYYRLKPRLKDAPADEIRAFLRKYDGSAIADRLRNDWLLELGRMRDWANFERELPLFVRNDDYQVRLYALLARALKGEKVADEARAQLTNPPGYGDAGAALVAHLAQTGQFTTNDLLAQLRLAGEMHATGPARRTALLLGASDTRAAQAVDFPALAMARGIGKTRAEHEIYLIAIGRMARTSLKLATVALDKNASKLSAEERAIGWSNVALAASLALAPEAADYWKKAHGAPLSLDQLQWKTRIALRHGDWKQVRATIEAMPRALRDDPVWIYWRGRALASQGDHEQAEALYRRIAEQNTFYGQLAMEELGDLVTIPPMAAAPTPAEMALVSANPGFKRALKFFSLGLRFEGTREWNWTLRDFSERQLLAAAEYARQNNILDRMIDTSGRTRKEFNYAQRFPDPHDDIMGPAAKGLGLDRAWIYGLIRQESRFIPDARSGAGASGLMQVMPSTGKWVAGKIGLSDFVHTMLHDLHTNITLGTNYLNMVLTGQDNSQVLATAAYNAGPSRARSWRGTLRAPMESAVFIETIPFSETRIYVRNVMANATNYAALFTSQPQSLKARIGSVAPSGTGAAILP